MSHSTAFCYFMYNRENEVKTNPIANFFNWRNCFLLKSKKTYNTNNNAFFGFGRFGMKF